MYTPGKPHFFLYKVNFSMVFITRTCQRDEGNDDVMKLIFTNFACAQGFYMWLSSNR